MDIRQYAEKKPKGLAEVIKVGGGYALAFKKWDADTGKLEDPTIQSINLDALAEIKLELKSQIADVDALVADAEAL